MDDDHENDHDRDGDVHEDDHGHDDPDSVIDDLDHPVLLFDGVCNLCNAVVRFTVRYDEAGVFRFAPLQSTVGRRLLERHGRPTDEFDSFVLVDGDAVYTKSTAALHVCRRLDGPLYRLYHLIHIPVGLRDRVYDFVADHRYRVFGRTDECPVPAPEIRERFLERSLA